jgi:hypothetical protein
MRRRWLLVLGAFAVVLAGCQVDAVVTIKVDDDGSGTVSARLLLDAEAVQALETPTVKLKDALRLGDLASAGWEVSRWHRRENGGASIVVSKDFERAEDAADVVAELNGSVGPLRDIEVERDVSTFRTQWSFSGVADLEDLTTGIGADPRLVERLAAERLDVAALDEQLLAKVKDGFRLRVVADLPDSAAHRFTIAPGTVREMRESSSQRATGRMFLFAVALLVLVVAGLVFLFGEVRDWRRRRTLAAAAASGGPSGRRIALFDDDADENGVDTPEDAPPP